MKITGTALDAKTREPLGEAKITLKVGTTELASLYSDAKGSFEHEETADHLGETLTCTAEKEGFKSKTLTHKIEEETIPLEIAMEKEAEEAPPKRRFRISPKILIGAGIAIIAIVVIVLAVVGLLVIPKILKKAPLTPSELVATAVSSSQVDLTWKDKSENEDGFKVFRNGEEIKDVKAGQESYQDRGREPDTEYIYFVKAFNDAGESPPSNKVRVSTPVFIPIAAKGISPGDIANWNTAHDWGDHATAGYLTGFTETDPQVGSNTTNYVSKWNGSALVTGTIYDNGNVGIGASDPKAKLTIQQGGTDAGDKAKGKTLFVSGAFNPGTKYDGGIEFRHDNLTQGIGFGYQSIYATGSNKDQPLNIYARGNGFLTLNAYGGGNVGIGTKEPKGKLDVNGDLIIHGSADISGQLKPGYDSGWFKVQSKTANTLKKKHNLGVIPTRYTVQFSPDSPPSQYVYDMTGGGWYDNKHPENSAIHSASVRFTKTEIAIGLWNGGYVGRFWSPETGWKHWKEGYYRLLLWK